ncbi:hypothetical protein HanHA300_Chr02g0070651 [Helianthus annuus]|nr:hypothetical protein HanHA300_Chr02g0070651 [Helianthus annuus]KAJ0620148.1 hypothetical protein HanHA89_Chr02g0079111 [Helianthus annuus]KAJ0778597.1 hypothetical protein HanLR1_Chr02g0073401 [Helianthus annuus]
MNHAVSSLFYYWDLDFMVFGLGCHGLGCNDFITLAFGKSPFVNGDRVLGYFVSYSNFSV